MPVTPPPSFLEPNLRGIDLLPGEDHVDLKPDPYYGMVEKAVRLPHQPERPVVRGERLQREVTANPALLDGDEQNFIEVMTGKRLQQFAPGERPEPPVDALAPVLTSLEPNFATIGEPSFTMRVLGENFVEGSVIVFNGFDEPTTLVSPTEVTTGINMDVWTAQSAPLPVEVRNPDGDISNSLTFIFNMPAAGGEGEAAREGSRREVDMTPKTKVVINPKKTDK